MEKYAKLADSFTRKHYLPFLGVTLLFCLLSGGIVSFRNLDSIQAAKAMELYVCLVGPLLLTPLFMPEQDKEIWFLEKAKAMAMWKNYIIRWIEAVLLIVIIITVFIWELNAGGSQFEVWPLWQGAFCEALFLGCIGFFVSAVTNQVIIGYMLSLIYYAANIGGSKYFGPFALLQMRKGHYDFWPYLLIGGLFLTVCGILLRERVNNC